MKMVHETRKIIGVPDLPVTATCVRVPVGDRPLGGGLGADPRGPRARGRARRPAPGPWRGRADDPSTDTYPTALQAAGSDEVFVGRIRRDLGRERSLAMWMVSDNLRKGAATNAVRSRSSASATACSAPRPRLDPSGADGPPGAGREQLPGAPHGLGDEARGSSPDEPAELEPHQLDPAHLRSVKKPKSARKSRGKIVRCSRKRAANRSCGP